jgi:hypothetical protein
MGTGLMDCLDCTGCKAAGYAIIALVALKHSYEIRFWGVLTYMENVCVDSSKG